MPDKKTGEIVKVAFAKSAVTPRLILQRIMKPGIYLDYAASTLVDPLVFEAMAPYFSEKFGNPGSLHAYGQEAIAAVDRSREAIAKAIAADFREVIFTASA